ncbi:hypothetical protein QYF36_014353 [Acer negundo]|nr:hypothetical protein QYF36_014353 [Acer negundo]
MTHHRNAARIVNGSRNEKLSVFIDDQRMTSQTKCEEEEEETSGSNNDAKKRKSSEEAQGSEPSLSFSKRLRKESNVTLNVVPLRAVKPGKGIEEVLLKELIDDQSKTFQHEEGSDETSAGNSHTTSDGEKSHLIDVENESPTFPKKMKVFSTYASERTKGG